MRTASTVIRAGGHTKTYTHRYTYDNRGRPGTVEFPSGLEVRYGYNAQGYLETVTDTSDSDVLQTFDAMNAYGQVTSATYGNSVETTWAHDPETGRLTNIDTTLETTVDGTATTTTIQDNTYAWRSDGILKSRLDASGTVSRTETFVYDLLNRLKRADTTRGSTTTTTRRLAYTYDRLGNRTGRTSSVSTEPDQAAFTFGTESAPTFNRLTGVTIGTGNHTITDDTGGKVTR